MPSHRRRSSRTSRHQAVAGIARDPVASAARMTVERLEDRTMLSSNDPLSDPQLAVIKSGLSDFAQWADTLTSYGEFGKDLPVIGKSVGDVLKVGQQLKTKLADLVSGIDPNQVNVADDLVTLISSMTGVSAADVNKVANPSGGDSFLYSLKFSTSDTAQTTLDLGDNAAGAKLDASAQVTLDTSVQLNFAFGIDLTPGLAPSEAFFIQLSSADPANPTGFKARVALNASNFQLGGSIGIAKVSRNDPLDRRERGQALQHVHDVNLGIALLGRDLERAIEREISGGRVVDGGDDHVGFRFHGFLLRVARQGSFSHLGARLVPAAAPVLRPEQPGDLTRAAPVRTQVWRRVKYHAIGAGSLG